MNVDTSTTIGLLVSLGLSRNEALTYNALLQIDEVSIRKIAAYTGINRGTTYEALKKLIALGLVSVKHQGSREHYTAESPEKIFDIIRDHRRDLLDAAASAKKIVPALVARQATQPGRPVVRYYEDDDGIVTILKDVLQTCRNLAAPEYYAYSSSHIRHYLYRKFPQFTKRRVAEGIHVKVIAVGEGGELAENAERKWLPNMHATDASSYTLIYGNKVAVVSITSNNTPYGVVIEDQSAASMHRLIFDQLWRHTSN